ncbi:MAG: ribosomal protein L13e [Fervidicoccaceae archaeon]
MEIPEAVVSSPRVPNRLRPGRGFSLRELEAAGLDAERARRLGLRVDPRRRSLKPENVEALRRLVESSKRGGEGA